MITLHTFGPAFGLPDPSPFATKGLVLLKMSGLPFKTERTAGKNYRTRDSARADVFDYIERFYNPRRRHSTLGYVSPVAYEDKMRLA